MMKLHQKCNYQALLDHYCPQETMLSSEDTAAIGKLNHLRHHSNFHQVSGFVRAVVRRVIPHDIWGDSKNEDAALKALDKFIRLRRYETLSLQNVSHGLKVSKMAWLEPPKYRDKDRTQIHTPPSDTEKRRELLFEWLYWFFDGFIISLIKTTFYVTESAPHRNRVFYFRQDVWKRLTAPAFSRLSETLLEPVAEETVTEGLYERALGYSYVRLLPKEVGFRPITNLRRKLLKKSVVAAPLNKAVPAQPPAQQPPQLQKLGSSINSILQNAFQVLNFEKVTDFEDGSLIETLDSKTTGEFSQFSDLAQELAQGFRNAIFVDQVAYNFEDREKILRLLQEHLCNNIVKLGKRFYRQITGIPQGSILSTLLCSFFYADLERTELTHLLDDNSVLLRLVDDFLYITTKRQNAVSFLENMNKGHPSHGCFINLDKTLTNFDVIVDGIKLRQVEDVSNGLHTPTEFPWCGLLIDTRTLSVKGDYTRLADKYISESLTVNITQNPGSGLQLKMFQLSLTSSGLSIEVSLLTPPTHRILKPKCHAIFLDTSLNSTETVLVNVYQNFYLCAIKFYLHVKGMPNCPAGPTHRDRLLIGVIAETLRFAYILIRSRVQSLAGVRNQCQCTLASHQVTWLGLHAFSDVLRKKQTSYKNVLAWLDSELTHPRFKRLSRSLESVVNPNRCKVFARVRY
ncbi:hypothetical protein HK104_007493 [Borealophlyctis nickersoniae]|nr:hypothetical protein HK104_007493 [Borealophlyctis nickersoniae]